MAGYGGNRKGAGRKTKAEELGLAATLDKVFTEEEKLSVFKALLKEAKAGSKPHAELLLAYYYGKPTEHIISENDNETIVKVVRDAGIINQPEEAAPETGANTEGS